MRSNDVLQARETHCYTSFGTGTSGKKVRFYAVYLGKLDFLDGRFVWKSGNGGNTDAGEGGGTLVFRGDG